MEYEEVSLSRIMNFPPSNSGLTRKMVSINEIPNSIPVYSASKDKDFVFGWIDKENKKWKVYENALTWNTDGVYAGCVFYRTEKFIPYEKIKVLKIKEEFKNSIFYPYVQYVLETILRSMGFGWEIKCSMEKIFNLLIPIPVDKNKKFDLEKQKKIAEKYTKIEKIKNKLKEDYQKIEDMKIDFNSKYEKKLIYVTGEKGIFEAEKGDAKYTKKYMHDHRGEFPVYSSQTSDLGKIGSIDTFDYEEECFTWTTDGTYVGTVFYRNGKFSITTHCGILRVKPEFKGKVDFKYLNFILNQTLPNYKLGEGSNKRLGTERMKEVQIEIPISENGEFDFDKQKEIANKYQKITKIKRQLKEQYSSIIHSKVKLIESLT